MRWTDRQKHTDKHVNFSRNPDTQKCKTTTTNNRIHQYLLVCPAAYEVFFVYYSMYFLEQLSEIGGIIPVLLLRTVKLSEVNNMHRGMPVVHRGFAVPALVCDWAMLPWERQLAHFLLSGKVSVGIYILSVKLSKVCTVLLGSTKEVPGFFPTRYSLPGVIRPKYLLSAQKLSNNIFKKLPLIRILSSESHSL